MKLDKAIDERHSVKNFKKKKKVNWRDIIEAIDAARKAPLAGNLSTLRFILVSEKDKIEKISKASQQKFVADVNYVVVVCSDSEQQKRNYNKRGLRYCKQQAGAAIENFLLKITDLKLSTCWVGAFSDKEVKNILNIPDNIDIEALFPIGYEMGEKNQAKKPNLDNILYYNKWNEKHMKQVRKPEALA